MPRPEFDLQKMWEQLYAVEEKHLADGSTERSWTDGEDGEKEFDRRVLANAKGKDVIDIGCGTGQFTLEIATVARRVVGIDFSERALRKAVELESKPALEFRLSQADKIPYSEENFDLAISRRGPATDTSQTISEVYRVLRKEGQLMVQDIGERDKQNWIQVFGRGQTYPATGIVGSGLKEKLARAGFKDVIVEDFEVDEYFEGIHDVLMRLEDSPIVPDFDRERDKLQVHELVKRFASPKGIRTNSHRVLIMATK